MILGIEIESSSVKVADVRKRGELFKWEIFDLPEGVIGIEGIIDIEAFVKVLMRIPTVFGIKNPDVAFSVSGPAYTAVRMITLPFISEDEIALNLPLELDKHIPFDIKEVYYDFQILQKFEDSTKLLIAVANKQIVNEYIHAFQRAGMTPVIVDMGTLALYNIYEFNYYDEPSTVGVANIGKDFINFLIAKNNKPLYVRDSTSDAFKLIKKASEEEIKDFADGVATEIYRHIEYFKSFEEKENVKKIYITGFPLSFPSFVPLIEERLEQEILPFNPFKKIKLNKKISAKMQEYMNIASISIGLSLRGVI